MILFILDLAEELVLQILYKKYIYVAPRFHILKYIVIRFSFAVFLDMGRSSQYRY